MEFLSKNGQAIYKNLSEHCKKKLKMFDVDDYELKMLANSFDIYAVNAKYCNDNGQTWEMPTKTGTYPMIRPEFNVMKAEAQNILKLSSKFGLSPADREQIFKGIKEEKKRGFKLD